MKKVIFALAAVVALAACSQEDVIVADKGAAIGFDTFVENSTRSVEDPSYTNSSMFSDFAVYGFVEGAVLFDGVKVAKTIDNDDLTSAWKYAGTQYWIAGAQYNFNAVAPMTDGGWTKTAATAESTTLSFTNNGTTDLLYATAAQEGKASGNTMVEFSFRHVLSKVKFSFENAYNATNATIRVKDVKINDAYASGSVVLDDETVWTPANPTLALAFGNVATNAADNAAKVDENDKGLVLEYGDVVDSYNELLMIPGQGSADYTVEETTYTDVYKVTFTVELLVSGQEVAQYNHTIYTNFAPKAGMRYNLKAVITPENIDPQHKQEPIEFTVYEIKDWENGNTVDADDPKDGVNDHYPLN